MSEASSRRARLACREPPAYGIVPAGVPVARTYCEVAVLHRLPLMLVLIALLLVACAGPSEPSPNATLTPSPAPTPTPTPREISAAIGRATLESQSVNFVIELSGRPVAIDASSTTFLNRMEGDLQRPDGVLALLSVTLGASAVAEIRTVSLDGRQYITNPITREWTCLAPGAAFDPAILFAPDQGIEHLLQAGFQEVTLVGTEQIDERPHYHLRGAMDGAQLQAISLGLLGAGPVAVDLWADAATMRLTRLVLVDSASDPSDPSTWTINFRDYGKAVDVRAPVQCP
jgi:lipoprotein LprG